MPNLKVFSTKTQAARAGFTSNFVDHVTFEIRTHRGYLTTKDLTENEHFDNGKLSDFHQGNALISFAAKEHYPGHILL